MRDPGSSPSRLCPSNPSILPNNLLLPSDTTFNNYKQAVDEGRILEEVKGSGYPPNLDVLVSGVPDAKSPNRDTMLYFLRRIPRDPMAATSADSASGNAAANAGSADWGLRSYASPATAPQPGLDVFDVYSRSPATGLNGIAYREW